MFKKNDIVRHTKSGNEYTIIATPDKLKIESTGEPAYAYGNNSVTWVRPQSEMDDGRFEYRGRSVGVEW